MNPDPELIDRLKALLQQETLASSSFTPLSNCALASENREYESLGLKLLHEGKCACLVVAGGQGSRLNFSGPKGAFPCSSVKHKSLFQLLAERCKAASDRAGQPIPLLIMTSADNRRETEAFFREHEYFDLEPTQLFFFDQGSLPLLTERGELAEDEAGRIAYGPDGNGGALKSLVESGLADQLKRQGVEYFTFHIVDNALADPFDPLLIGYHAKTQAEVTVKSILRTDPKEKVGVLVVEKGKIAVKEYSELPQEVNTSAYSLANISLFCFSLSFAFRIAKQSLPLHKAFKKSLWKFEYFIFDLLNFSQKTGVLLYPREGNFSPLKEPKDVEVVQKAMTTEDQALLYRMTGKKYNCKEIDRAFYYLTPSQEILLRAFPPKDTPYIEYHYKTD